MTIGERLIFLVSTPRSGSTLLQRLLANSDEICTDVESWVMLHPLYALRSDGIETDYPHQTARSALQHFLSHFELGEEGFNRAVRAYGDTLYGQALTNTGKRYYLDKTPPYTRIAEEIQGVYPEAKYIFLLRNPMAVLYSSLKTWLNGEWDKLYWCEYDLLGAFPDLVSGMREAEDKACIVHYEQLVESPQAELVRLGQFLGVELGEEVTYGMADSRRDKSVEKQDQFFMFQGDPRSVESNDRPNSAYAEKWKSILDSDQTLHFAQSYLKLLDDDLLRSLGYDGDALRSVIFPEGRVITPNWRKGIIRWEIAIKPPERRTRAEKLEILRAKAIAKSPGGVSGFWGHLRHAWKAEALSLLRD